jgi:hypothetical protein
MANEGTIYYNNLKGLFEEYLKNKNTPGIDWGKIYGERLKKIIGDDTARQKYVDIHYGGDESLFVADYNKYIINTDLGGLKGFQDSGISDMYSNYYENYVERSQADTAGQIFGEDGTGVGLESDMTYEEKLQKRSELLKSVLGSEIANIGGANEDITTLAEFAEYNPLTPQELEQDAGKLTPLKDRKQELKKITTGQTVEKTGMSTREMLKKVANTPISGLKTATGTSEGSSAMQSTFKKLAEKSSAQNAMQERVSQFIDKQEATSKLSKIISSELAYDVKREAALKSSKARTAVGLAGSQLTAQEHAAQLAKSSKI